MRTLDLRGTRARVCRDRPPTTMPRAGGAAQAPALPSMTGDRQAEVLHTPLPGADLLVRRKPGVPLVTLGIYVPRVELDPPAQAGLGALVVRSAVRGAGDLDAGQPGLRLRAAGRHPQRHGGFRLARLRHHGPVRAPRPRPRRCSIWSSPSRAWVTAEVSTERGLMVIEAEQVADDMFRYPFQLAFAGAFGEGRLWASSQRSSRHPPDHLHGRRAGLAPAAMLGVPPGGGRGGRCRSRGSQRCVGRGSSATGQRLRTQPGPRRRLAWAGGRGEASVEVVEREKAQAALAMAFPGPGPAGSGSGAAEVWAAVASGLGGRMFEALRDRRSLAYTVMASSWQRGRAGALLTYIATSPQSGG